MIDRRTLLALVGAAAAAVPQMARSQQKQPVIGYLSGGAPGPFAQALAAFRQAAADAGFVEGLNLTIEYRWAEGRYEQLPALAAELVTRKVDVIVASGGDLAAQAAKAATTTIPIVFSSGDAPVFTGLVASLARPGGNLTGISFLVVELHPKRLQVMIELVPSAKVIGLLANPRSPQFARIVRALEETAKAKGLQLAVVQAASTTEIDNAFAELAGKAAAGLVVQGDPYFITQSERIIALAAKHRMPAIHENRRLVESGGLVSYGASQVAVYRQLGEYAVRILKGAKPADLAVQRPVKFEMVLNMKTAKALGLTVPPLVLAQADEVIE